MAIRRNSSRSAAQVGELLEELRRINTARDAEGRPQINPFADLDFDVASADAPAGVSFLSFPLRNPSRTRDALGSGNDVLLGDVAPSFRTARGSDPTAPTPNLSCEALIAEMEGVTRDLRAVENALRTASTEAERRFFGRRVARLKFHLFKDLDVKFQELGCGADDSG